MKIQNKYNNGNVLQKKKKKKNLLQNAETIHSHKHINPKKQMQQKNCAYTQWLPGGALSGTA